MNIDYSKIDYQGLKEEGAVLYRVYHFSFRIANELKASIQVLEFEHGYGSQAKLFNIHNSKSNKKSVSSGQTFKTVENAINDCIKLIKVELIEERD